MDVTGRQSSAPHNGGRSPDLGGQQGPECLEGALPPPPAGDSPCIGSVGCSRAFSAWEGEEGSLQGHHVCDFITES